MLAKIFILMKSNGDNLFYYFSWIEDLSFIKWSNVVQFTNQFKSLTFSCDSHSACVYSNGQQVLQNLNFNFNEGYALLILLGMLIFWKILAYLALVRAAKTAIANA